MAALKYRARNGTGLKEKPRVLFTCHPDDFEKHFDKICDDIFKTQDCVIYYTEDMTANIPDQDKDIDIGSNNLVVVPVTFKLLTTPNRAMDEDLVYAFTEHIPVLPIMMETGIDQFYAQPDKFGEMQYLNPYSDDATEISYDIKLEKFLASVLISSDLANRVRAAFDAYIFLSYRKKDRNYANQLMRLIHSHPECRDIAIWYDEFLTPGESFKENINKILSDSKLFALLVTPSLLEEPGGKPNYVMAEEYPAAYKAGIDILPAEMKKTDRERLSKKYKEIPTCVDPYDNFALKERLMNSIFRIVRTANDDDPMHNFLIGLAYLDGIDVETDRPKGVSLIEKVADSGLEEAMHKMIDIYTTGKGVYKSYYRAKEWHERILSLKESQSDNFHGMVSLMIAYDDYCDFLASYFLLEYSSFVDQKMLPAAQKYVAGIISASKETDYEEMLFWLCKSYYRSVEAGMLRNADNHNAESYCQIIESYLPYIKSQNNRIVLEECLAYLKDCISFWDKMDKVISDRENTEEDSQKNQPIEKILSLIAECEVQCAIEENADSKDELLDAYSMAMDYYEKEDDLANYSKYTLKYLTLKEDVYHSDPEIMDGVEIACVYNDLVFRLIKKDEKETAIDISRKYINFLEYLAEIGAEYGCECYDAWLQLAQLYEDQGELILAKEAVQQAAKYKTG